MCLFHCLLASLLVSLSVLLVCLFSCLLACLLAYFLFVCLSVCLSVCLPVCLSVYLFACLFNCVLAYGCLSTSCFPQTTNTIASVTEGPYYKIVTNCLLHTLIVIFTTVICFSRVHTRIQHFFSWHVNMPHSYKNAVFTIQNFAYK